MKTYIPKKSPLISVILFVLQDYLNKCDSVEESELVLVTDPAVLRDQYRPDKFFGFIAHQDFERENSKKQPDNIFVMTGADVLVDHPYSAHAFFRAHTEWKNRQKSVVPSRVHDHTPVTAMSRSYFVLVVDDTEANLETAIARLPGQKLILARGPEEAMKYLNLEGEMPDAVLTDMQMRPDKVYGSLSLDCYGVTETVHNGFSMMFEVTKRGIPVAIVTDGNHHQDWVSAMFDHIKEQEVNGQKVLFFNNIGKRWDTALKMLMEPDDSVQ